MNNPRYNLVISYSGYDLDYDSKIEAVVGRESSGAGFGFGRRDLSFWFGTKPSLSRAVTRSKRLRKYKVSIDVWDVKTDTKMNL